MQWAWTASVDMAFALHIEFNKLKAKRQGTGFLPPEQDNSQRVWAMSGG